MAILKFWNKNGKTILQDLFMKDITNDDRTQMLDKDSFLKREFKVSNGVYMAKNEVFMNMSRRLNRKKISAIKIDYKGNLIIIVSPKSYVFWNGKSIEPKEYSILSMDLSVLETLKNGPIEDG